MTLDQDVADPTRDPCPVCGDDHSWQHHPVCYPRYLQARLREAEAENQRLRVELVGREDEEYAVAPGLETAALEPKESQ